MGLSGNLAGLSCQLLWSALLKLCLDTRSRGLTNSSLLAMLLPSLGLSRHLVHWSKDLPIFEATARVGSSTLALCLEAAFRDPFLRLTDSLGDRTDLFLSLAGDNRS